MVSTYLYSADGRVLYCVAVALPMKQCIAYAGLFFVWNQKTARYEETDFHAEATLAKGEPPATPDQHPKG